MPAAVVIPAPLAYIKVVAVKKLVLSLFVETTKFKSYLSHIILCKKPKT